MTPRYRSRRARMAALSAQLRADGHSWAQVARVIQEQEQLNARVALRLAHGWTQEEVATRWNERWLPKNGSAGLTDKNISCWETWPHSGVEPSIKTLRRLAQLYQCDVGQLVEDGDYGHLDEANSGGGAGQEPLALAPPPGQGPIPEFASDRQHPHEVMAADGRLADLAIAHPHLPGDDEDVDRRAFLGFGLGGSAMLAVHVEQLRLRLDAALGAPTASSDADEWEGVAWDYARKVGYVPPELVLSDILVDLHEVSNRLADCPDSLRPRLMRVCGQLAALAAVVFIGVGDPGSARRYWRTAVRAGDQSGDPEYRSMLRGNRTVWAIYEQRPMTTILELADGTIAVAGGRPCSGAARAYAARARALARLGRHAEAQEAFAQLSDVFARLPESTTSDRVSQWGWSEKQFRCVQSEVYSLAGAVRAASDAQDAMPALCPPMAYQSPTEVELHRSACLIVAGDPGEGARHVVRILEALPDAHRRDVVVRGAAEIALSRVPGRARQMPDVVAARELLALPVRQ
jgi:transcriptional regulator with XRE-family HTH domain